MLAYVMAPGGVRTSGVSTKFVDIVAEWRESASGANSSNWFDGRTSSSRVRPGGPLAALVVPLATMSNNFVDSPLADGNRELTSHRKAEGSCSHRRCTSSCSSSRSVLLHSNEGFSALKYSILFHTFG